MFRMGGLDLFFLQFPVQLCTCRGAAVEPALLALPDGAPRQVSQGAFRENGAGSARTAIAGGARFGNVGACSFGG